MKFEGLAIVIPASAMSNPDTYLCIGDDPKSPVLRVGNRTDPSMQAMADALNEWAGKGKEEK